jgi:hypothetical protein
LKWPQSLAVYVDFLLLLDLLLFERDADELLDDDDDELLDDDDDDDRCCIAMLSVGTSG